MKRFLEIAISLAAGLVGAALFFAVAFGTHLGGLGNEAQTVTVPASAASEFNSVPVSSGAFAGPEQVYAKYADSVVQIVSTFEGQGSGVYHSSQDQQGIGSGFVASPDGYILTNAHVVTSDTSQQSVKASDIEVNFKDGKKAKASIVGYDLTSSDVAVIKIDPEGLELKPVILGDSDAVRVGESVYAIGSPFGVYASTITAGIVSATKRTVESPEAGFAIQDAIQTDAAINQGNSGGPLFNARSEVIGLNEQIATVSGGSEGIGFAVPINTAKKVMEQIISSGSVEYAWMGVVGQTVDQESAKRLELSVEKGALISEVQSGGPSEKAGLQAKDVIIKIDDQEIASMENVTSNLVAHRPGDKIKVTYMRGGETKETEVELGKRPERL